MGGAGRDLLQPQQWRLTTALLLCSEQIILTNTPSSPRRVLCILGGSTCVHVYVCLCKKAVGTKGSKSSLFLFLCLSSFFVFLVQLQNVLYSCCFNSSVSCFLWIVAVQKLAFKKCGSVFLWLSSVTALRFAFFSFLCV